MIRAQELRIGNFVMVNGEIEEIFGICEDYPFLKTAKYGACVIEYRDLDPITLTEDLLIKLGFVRNQIKTISEVIDISENDKHLEFEITEVGLDLWISSDKIDEALYFPINHIKFVHQLQNLFFALTQQELKLN